MSAVRVRIDVRCEPRLCYAMQQCAVPWLRAIEVRNGGEDEVRDIRVTVEFEPAFAAPISLPIAAIPPGDSVALTADPALDPAVLANQVERVRGEVRAVARAGEEVVAEVQSPLDVLAYNEWPGLTVLPGLLAAFVQPNHPILGSVLRALGERLRSVTGRSTLDGYRSKDRARVRAMLEVVYERLAGFAITYVAAPPSFEKRGQKIRTPEQVLGDRLGTCLDLAVVFAALLEAIGLHPLLILQCDHAFVGVRLEPGSGDGLEIGSAVELRKRCDAAMLEVVECTAICGEHPLPFAAAARKARQALDDDARFVASVDVRAARDAGILPLPSRTSTFEASVVDPPSIETDSPFVEEPPEEPAIDEPVEEPGDDPVVEPPRDRLEHWKSKLLDLTLFNRLLNFRETKKTIRLCGHDLAALENRLQQGSRMRVLPRPDVGREDDPRDLELAEERTGVDVVARYLSSELRSGRLRADHDAEDLDARLVQVFRHARTSLEESGANTLYLAVGFLRWYETPQAQKERRAPLLLLPLVIERMTVQEGFRVVLDDAEPRINQTLLQMLRRDFHVDVPIDRVPEDEHGIDVESVLDTFRSAAVGMPRWEVEASAHIGFFSFSKYLMWLDLAERDELMQSPVLRHLVESVGAGFEQDVPQVPRDELDELDPAEIYCPMDADSSQLAAVLAGAAGRTFVLEGPPGTGKSQTITNLIAQALASGKRVLFVAEKRAALEVVQRRLDGVGLGPFCLELHSSKSGPKAVLEQLRRPLELSARRPVREWEELSRELYRERERLDGYVHAVHKRREHGFSVFDAIGRLIDLGGARRVRLPDLLDGTPADIESARQAVEDLAASARDLGVPCRHPWWGARRTDWSPALLRRIENEARRVGEEARAFSAWVESASSDLGLETVFGSSGPSRVQIEKLLELGELFLAPALPPASLLRVEDWTAFDAAVKALCRAGRARDELWKPLAERWHRNLLTLDLGDLAARYRRWADTFFLLRWWNLRVSRRVLEPSSLQGLGAPAEVRDDVERALRAAQAGEGVVVTTEIEAAFGHAFVEELACFRVDWDRIDHWMQWVRDARRLLVELVPGSLRAGTDLLSGLACRLEDCAAGSTTLSARLAELRAANDRFEAAVSSMAELVALDRETAFGGDEEPGWLGAVLTRAECWVEERRRFPDWCVYVEAAGRVTRFGAAPLVEEHASGELSAPELREAFERSFLEGWIDRVHAAEPTLAMFRGREHEKVIAHFRELDVRSIELAAKVVQARLASRLPQLRDTSVASSELGILARELKKRRRHKPVRRLLAETRGLLTRLAPCVLMSPLSVAQFLGRSGMRFDLVVFDEASQIPMWDAVGAIGRGDSLVVVGDSRQLPPTSFFRRIDLDEDEADDLPDDLESVLDECGAAGLPRMHLDWHYRSRHESLIAFSNYHYYDNRLLTFPAPAAAGPGAGVRFVAVDGIYDRARSQQNRIEADALVADVMARLRDPARCNRSIGIVTFSRAQQVLIEDLLDRKRAECPEIEPFFTAVEEPVFVKNLENVQGDERDTILFSICYGPDAAGKVYENYGPLNQQGGERRLNVAVTRARRELVVFSSLHADRVARRSQALGARHLRAFLDYAERGEVALVDAVSVDRSADVESPFERQVRDALRARGHEVHAQIGCSGYRIDLGIVDPEAPGRYLLGIECDGATYHAAATARDRDRIREAVLRGLGWKLHRVWSSDFWQDPDGEIDRIEGALDEARRAAPPVSLPAPTPVPEPASEPEPEREPEPAPDPSGPRPYVRAELRPVDGRLDFHDPGSSPTVSAQIEQLLETEGPIVFDRVVRSIARAWGIGRATAKVRARIAELMSSEFAEREGAWFRTLAAAEEFAGFRVPGDDESGEREAEELPIVEVEQAMRWLLRQHHALSADDLAREAARVFGIHRLGSIVRGAMERALERVLASGFACREGGLVRLRTAP